MQPKNLNQNQSICEQIQGIVERLTLEIVTQNPYRLAIDVYGIGFTTADTIARNLGITPNSEFRYRSCLLHILNEASEEGHCFLPETELA